jgi:uncharacterized membrane protein
MPTKQLSEYTIEELHKRLKQLKVLSMIYAVALLIMIATSVYTFVQNRFSTITMMPLFFIPMYLMLVFQSKKIKTEIDSRK